MVETRSTDPSGPSPGDRLFRNLRNLVRTMTRLFQRQVYVDGLTMHQAMTIMRLHEEGEAIPGDLASELGITPASVSGLLTRLEARGLIERRPDQLDRRKVWVSLSERGGRVAGERRTTFDAHRDQLLSDWDPEEMETLAVLLAKLERSLAKAEEQPPLPPPPDLD